MARRQRKDPSSPVFRGHTISELITRPLLAVVRANEAMAKQQVRWLMRTCFYNRGGVLEPVMITMSITRGVIEPPRRKGHPKIERVTTEFQIPLITILPLNSLGVEETNLNFYMDVYCRYEIDEEMEGGSLGGSLQPDGAVYELAGSIGAAARGDIGGSDERERSKDANIDVSVVAGSLPLPKGVLIILDAYSNAITPSEQPKEPREPQGQW